MLANVGIATGPASSLVVLDIDPRHGGDDSLADLQSEHGALPLTVTALTGGGGQHHYFALARAVPEWLGNRVRSGLSSGEGLIWAVRDPIERSEPIKEKGRVVAYQTVITDPGVDDKRLLLLEPEFARVLGVMTRSGNTLSPVVRQAWDRRNLDSLTKNSPARATGAHISVIGHITIEELQRELGDIEIANGFANRFIWFLVRRSKLLPIPTPFVGADVDDLVEEIRSRVALAQSFGELKLTSEACDLWVAMYPSLTEARPGLGGAILARGEPQTLRLAAIYALMDGSTEIGAAHLASAAELGAYSERSTQHIWSDKLGDPIADTIAAALLANGRLTRSQISDLFGRHIQAGRIDAALQRLFLSGKAHPNREESGGRPIEVWERAA